MSLSLPESIRILLPDGSVKRLLVEDYLRGVVAAALVPDASLEAHKALAVAARTFAANTHRHTDKGADVCTLRHCQQWNPRANPRAARAVLETRGIVATYNDQLIEAFYFDHCDGMTRSAKGVLMEAPGYLKSVTCPCGFASMKGHGIGMCLRGMLVQARMGATYDVILTHYYSGIALKQLAIDDTTRVREPITPSSRITPVAAAKTIKPTVEAAPTKPEPAPAVETQPKPKSTAPRRSSRSKPEQQLDAKAVAIPTESISQPPAEPTPQSPLPDQATAQPSVVGQTPQTPEELTAPPPDPRALLDVHSPDEDDLFFFLAVEDIQPKPQPVEPPPVAPVPPPPIAPKPVAPAPPPLTYDNLPPASMPEDLLEPVTFAPPPDAPPPFSMPEDLPSASELDFLAPPVGTMPEESELISDFVAPPSPIIEPDLAEFIPPIERFFAPLDAPPGMPENMPSFSSPHADETPISWAPPPPLQENAFAVNQPRILMDSLPGPRIIAGNLPKIGTVVTIHDSRGNSIITVSGVSKQYGSGGFEAPLTDDGAYQVKFDGTELDVNLQNETVFIYYQ